jgi:hypothetical protein
VHLWPAWRSALFTSVGMLLVALGAFWWG